MDYTVEPLSLLDREVTITDFIDDFTIFNHNDQLGQT
jgi:hypothetical protein